ncbi:MAG: PEGA domain-containing protein [Polyangiaceae bacterium]
MATTSAGRRRRALVVAALVLLMPQGSSADPTAPSAKDVDDARVLREAAAAAAEKKDYPTCKEKAALSFEKAKQPQSWGLEGLCEAEMKQWRDAAEHLAYAVQFDTNEKRVAEYKVKLTEAKTKVGTIEVKTAPEACELRVDDRPIGQSPRDVFVNPGRYRVTAEAKGYDAKTVEIEITAGGTKPLSIELSPLSAASSSTATVGGAAATTTGAGGTTSTGSGVVEPGASRPAWPIGVGFGLAAVGFGVGIGTAVAASAEPDFDCPETNCVEGSEFLDQRDTLSNASFWSLIAGGTVALATTGYLIWVVTAPRGKPAAALVLPVASPTFGGAAFVGQF